jgi:hypothetical protein
VGRKVERKSLAIDGMTPIQCPVKLDRQRAKARIKAKVGQRDPKKGQGNGKGKNKGSSKGQQKGKGKGKKGFSSKGKGKGKPKGMKGWPYGEKRQWLGPNDQWTRLEELFLTLMKGATTANWLWLENCDYLRKHVFVYDHNKKEVHHPMRGEIQWPIIWLLGTIQQEASFLWATVA